MTFLHAELHATGIRFPETCGLGIKPISRQGSERLVRAAIHYALREGRKSVTLVHKGNIMKCTEGAFRNWGYDVAKREFRAQIVTEREARVLAYRAQNRMASVPEIALQLEPGQAALPEAGRALLHRDIADALALERTHGGERTLPLLCVRDSIADITLQQVLTRPTDFDVIATTNLNGDYLSDAVAGQVGGVGMAPGANINFETHHAVFEATHGSAPKYADLDKVNPGSLILSGAMMLRYLGWSEAAELVTNALTSAITQRRVTYDLARLMPGAHEISCSEFANAVMAVLGRT